MDRDGVWRRAGLLVVFALVACLLGTGSSSADNAPPPQPNPVEHPNRGSAWPDVGWLQFDPIDCSLMADKKTRQQCEKYGEKTKGTNFIGLDGKIHCDAKDLTGKPFFEKCDEKEIRKEITGGRDFDPPPPAPPKPPPDPNAPVSASQLTLAWPDVSWIKANTIDCAGSAPEVYNLCRTYGLLTPAGFLGWDGKVHCDKLPEGHPLVGTCDPAAIRAQVTGGRTTDINVVPPSTQPWLRKVFEGLSKAWPTVTWIKDDAVMECGERMPVPTPDWMTCTYFGTFPGLLGADGQIHCDMIPKGDPMSRTCDPVKIKESLLDKSGKTLNISFGDFVPDVPDTVKSIVSAAGKVLKLPGKFAGWLANKGLEQLVKAAAESATTLFAKTAEFIFDKTAPDLHGTAFTSVYDSVATVMLALVFIFFVAAVLLNIVSDKFGHVPASVGGLIRAVLGICLAAKVADLMVKLSDQCTTALLESNENKPQWSAQAFADQLGEVMGDGGMVIVVLLASIFAIIGLIALMVIMFVRGIELYAAALFGAIAMVGQAHPHTHTWARKWFWNFTALAWSKFVIAALWLLAGSLIGEGDSLVAVLSGLGMIWMMVYAPFALMKMFSFIDAQATGIGNDVGAKMMNKAKDAAMPGSGSADDPAPAAPGAGQDSPGGSPASQMDANLADVESGMTGGDDADTDMDADDGDSAPGGGPAENTADGADDQMGTGPEAEEDGADDGGTPGVPEGGGDPGALNPGGDPVGETAGSPTGGSGPGSPGSSSGDEQIAADVALAGAGAGSAGSRGSGGSGGSAASPGAGFFGGSAPTSMVGPPSTSAPSDTSGADGPVEAVPDVGHNIHSGEEAWGGVR
ncbi:hypothetical protein ACIRL2_46945 [Embleya sp. NPDC127516]|uniref:hypothetical protein n=1 Tax=Embleya sp. NPDC127516 TaxID=3363990 RepID=UPI003813D62D